MPSPFQGMDPWLEAADLFPDLHDRLITYLSEALNAVLPAPYFTGIAARVWIETARRQVGPDVNALHPTGNGAAAPRPASGVGVGLLTEPLVIHVPREVRRETFVEVHADASGDRLVAVIEVLSPANKSPGD